MIYGVLEYEYVIGSRFLFIHTWCVTVTGHGNDNSHFDQQRTIHPFVIGATSPRASVCDCTDFASILLFIFTYKLTLEVITQQWD